MLSNSRKISSGIGSLLGLTPGYRHALIILILCCPKAFCFSFFTFRLIWYIAQISRVQILFPSLARSEAGCITAMVFFTIPSSVLCGFFTTRKILWAERPYCFILKTACCVHSYLSVFLGTVNCIEKFPKA